MVEKSELIDRPGELLHRAVEVANDLRRIGISTIIDPRDNTAAPFAIGAERAEIIQPTAFDGYRPKPIARTGTARHTRLDSFIAHVLRFKADHSAIFASDNSKNPKLAAVFDYHPEGPDRAETQPMKHRSEYAFPLSDEWKAWAEKDGETMAMTDFAAFLEDRIVDVVANATPSSPAAKDFVAKTGGNIASPSKLIEIARGLQVNESSVLREARNLSTGEAEVVFQSEHLDASGNKLTLPNLFMICLPVFARAPVAYQILARFRYRKVGGGIVFFYELWRPDLVFEQAFSEAITEVRQQTALPVFVGAAEA